jgi:hypothetical protein
LFAGAGGGFAWLLFGAGGGGGACSVCWEGGELFCGGRDCGACSGAGEPTRTLLPGQAASIELLPGKALRTQRLSSTSNCKRYRRRLDMAHSLIMTCKMCALIQPNRVHQ